ncbi:MAG: alanine--tRNA ligase, partial [Candidatus Omnitrophica bacterium]|nr:alanine--tRNA ligase [Candidatus Omnitrophota bacterium]
FTQFDRKDKNKLEPLPNKNIDTGMGLERISRVMQGKNTNFEIDSFKPITDDIRALSSKTGKDNKEINAIADHIRAIVFAIGDGVLPSNEDRGYVIRKLIRKAFWYGRGLGLQDPFLYKIVPVVARVMKSPYPELTEQREDIAQVVLAEEERFKNTIGEGLMKLNEIIGDSSGVISGKDAFKLYDTYGFPLELTQDIADAKKVKVDLKGFEKCMALQRAKSKKASKIKGAIFDLKGGEGLQLPLETIFIENKETIETEVLQVSGNSVFLKETNFYGEKGGQVGDTGALLKSGKVVADVLGALDVAGRVQHEVKMSKGMLLKPGDKITAKIDTSRRENIKKNHTATHLLHNALRQVLGQHVKQSGSLVAPDRLRFDFTHFKALTDEELVRIEELVNDNVRKNSPVCAKETTLDKARGEGAIALFGEKYGDTVRMVVVGDYSKELCGGTHVSKTKEIGVFKIISESSIASGTRRIEALTGEVAAEKIKGDMDLIKEIARELKTTPGEIPKEIERLNAKLKKFEKELSAISDKFAHANMDGLLGSTKKIKENDVIISEIKNADMALLRKTADAIKGRLKNPVFILVSEKDGKLSMIVGVHSSLDASKILNDIGADFGIRGGGRPGFAQAGGKAGPGVKEILKKAEKVIKGYL